MSNWNRTGELNDLSSQTEMSNGSSGKREAVAINAHLPLLVFAKVRAVNKGLAVPRVEVLFLFRSRQRTVRYKMLKDKRFIIEYCARAFS